VLQSTTIDCRPVTVNPLVSPTFCLGEFFVPPITTTAIGVGLVVIGAAYGIGKLAASALESMARQPEVAGSVQTAMIISAALIEGFTFYALYICSTAVGK
jgi:ATP synthase F0 subunit c